MKAEHKLMRRHYLLGIIAALLLLCIPVRTDAAASVQNEVFDYLISDMGFNPAAASGIMANIQAESGFQANINGLGGAFGLCQWDGGRITRLRSYCASHKLNASTVKGQLQFLDYELRYYYPKVWNYLRQVTNNAQGAYNAASYWCLYFEIPANRYARAVQRGSMARNTYWPQYGSKATYITVKSVKNGVKISWNKKSTAMRIMRAASINGDYTEVGTVKKGKNSFVDTSAGKRKKYYYYVIPTGKNSAASNKAWIATKRNLKDEEVTITLSSAGYVYNGKARTPKVKITYDGSKLKRGRDYTVTYKNNIAVGKATVIIQGKSSYTGTVKKKFTITRAPWKVKIKDIHSKLSKKQIKLNKIPGKYSLRSSDPAVVKVSGKKLLLQAQGECDITLKIKKDKTHAALEKTFHVTVQ